MGFWSAQVPACAFIPEAVRFVWMLRGDKEAAAPPHLKAGARLGDLGKMDGRVVVLYSVLTMPE